MLPKILTKEALASLVQVKLNDNIASLHAGLVTQGMITGLHIPHRLVPYLAQVGHEMGDYKWDREIWGPTPAQARYDTRTDLGNTAAKDGDGFKNRGRTGIHITGGYNIKAFRDWCRENVNADCPDFVEDPDLMNTDPWEGLGPIWYWQTRNLNKYADAGHFDSITRSINGGYNGKLDRQIRYAKIGLTALSYGTSKNEVLRFQANCGLTGDDLDGVIGPQTRGLIHFKLRQLPEIRFDEPAWSFISWFKSTFPDFFTNKDTRRA